ncbi:MAG: SelB C-terminal domain-containing protein, partial [Luminiphilus sp.]|nr:SelB C-terminal domain-containing protein [Luminiphilus sp.]
SVTGQGIDALKTHLMGASAPRRASDENEGFRLSIDRRFNVKGQGLVVTGTARAGCASVGDTLVLQPSGVDLRVRGLRCHDQDVETAHFGQRIAINLAGRVELEDVERGDWLTSPNSLEPSARLDVSFSLLSDAPFSLKHLAPVKLHLGAKRVSGRLALVSTSKRRLEPGDECLAQLILDDKVCSMVGDRFVIRDHAETRVLGGGRVLDPNGPKRGKSRAGRLQWLSAMQISDHELALQELLQNHQVVHVDRFWRTRNQMNSVLTAADSHEFRVKGQTFAVSGDYWKQACEQVFKLLDDFHRQAPTEPGLRAAVLINQCKPLLGTTLTQGVIVALAKAQLLKEKDGFIRTAAFASNEQVQDIPNWPEVESALKYAGKDIPMMSELATLSSLTENQASQAVKAGIERGLLHRISASRVALPQQLLWFANQIIATEGAGTELSVIELKTQFGLGRKLTIEILEYFDRVKFTLRQGDKRIIVNDDNVLDRFKT